MNKNGDPNAPSLDIIESYSNKLDAEHVQIQRCCENKCCRRKDGKFPFFPNMNQWWHKRRVYKRLLKYLRGNGGKIKGLQKECERHEIPQPCEMTIEKALEGIARCSDELDKLCPRAPLVQLAARFVCTPRGAGSKVLRCSIVLFGHAR